MKADDRGFGWAFLLGAGLLLAAGLVQSWRLAAELGVKSSSLRWTLFFALVGGLEALTLLMLARPAKTAEILRLKALRARLAPRTVWATLLIGLIALVYPLFTLAPLPPPLDRIQALLAFRLAVFWLAAWAVGALLWVRRPGRGLLPALGLSALGLGAVYRVAIFLPEISTYPFSLGWSEASRYYYASLFYAGEVYGRPAAWSVLHPSRYWLQSIPFLLGELPLWAHRLWQVLLWLVANGLAAAMLVRRLGRDRLGGWALPLGLWAFLFMFQGPIWYHLVLMVAWTLWGADPQRFWRTLLVVVAASLWAGVSRVNWIPLPAALAAVLYFLERPQGGISPFKYLSWPFFWGLAGGAAGLLAQSAYALASGNALEQFGSSFTSALLWYRLFPNTTFPLGVLPGILLASMPVLLALFFRLRGLPGALSFWRWAGIGGLLAVFFAGGLVVSAKIGGGSNLHNMDAFLVLLMVPGAWVWMDRLAMEAPGTPQPLPAWVLGFAVLVPVVFSILSGGTVERLDMAEAARELAELRAAVEGAAARGGEVLFIAERHLLAFQLVEGVPLVEEYEKVFLMEMAMSGNRNYLDRFQQDLEAGRFELIVSDTVRYNLQSRDDLFGEENNAWDQAVNYHILCHYAPAVWLRDAGVQLLAPDPGAECPQ